MRKEWEGANEKEEVGKGTCTAVLLDGFISRLDWRLGGGIDRFWFKVVVLY